MLTHPTTFHTAHFLALLPPNIPRPAIGRDNDGDTSFEWGQGWWYLSATITSAGGVCWSGLFGKFHVMGAARLELEIPHELMALLECWAFDAQKSR